MRRLFPEPAETVSVEEAYADVLGERDGAPWVTLCMVASIDGSTVVDGRSAQLSSPTDGEVLARCRSLADVVVVGAGTARTEGYGAPRRAGQRIGVVTSSGDVDLDGELFTSGAGFLIVPEDATFEPRRDVDVLRAGTGRVDAALAVRRLPDLVDGCRVVQAEGGPGLNGALVDGDVLDELNVTTSAGTTGGDGRRLTHGAGDHAHRFELAQLAIDDRSFLYARWLRRR